MQEEEGAMSKIPHLTKAWKGGSPVIPVAGFGDGLHLKVKLAVMSHYRFSMCKFLQRRKLHFFHYVR